MCRYTFEPHLTPCRCTIGSKSVGCLCFRRNNSSGSDVLYIFIFKWTFQALNNGVSTVYHNFLAVFDLLLFCRPRALLSFICKTFAFIASHSGVRIKDVHTRIRRQDEDNGNERGEEREASLLARYTSSILLLAFLLSRTRLLVVFQIFFPLCSRKLHTLLFWMHMQGYNAICIQYVYVYHWHENACVRLRVAHISGTKLVNETNWHNCHVVKMRNQLRHLPTITLQSRRQKANFMNS